MTKRQAKREKHLFWTLAGVCLTAPTALANAFHYDAAWLPLLWLAGAALLLLALSIGVWERWQPRDESDTGGG